MTNLQDKSYSVNNRLAVDGNCITYLFEAMKPGYSPYQDKSDLAIERKTMLSIFCYVGNLYTLPCAILEIKRIKEQFKQEGHMCLASHHILEIIELDESLISKRASKYFEFHKKKQDCQILAEAEIANEDKDISIDFLLTCDNDFLNRLQSRTQSVLLIRPSDYFKRLNLSPGAAPKIEPEYQNPTRSMDWWKI